MSAPAKDKKTKNTQEKKSLSRGGSDETGSASDLQKADGPDKSSRTVLAEAARKTSKLLTKIVQKKSKNLEKEG